MSDKILAGYLSIKYLAFYIPQSDEKFNILHKKMKGDTLTFWEYISRVSEKIGYITDDELVINGGCTAC